MSCLVTHLQKKKVSNVSNGSSRRDGATLRNTLPSPRRSGIVSQTHPLDYYPGFMKSSSIGQMIIRGTKMKVITRSFSPITKNNNLTFDTQVLTWISIYWFSRAGPAASLRIYYEMEKANQFAKFPSTTIPTGYSYFPKELCPFPRRYVVLAKKKKTLISNILFIFISDG